jgi:hypothetical protein
MIKLVVKHILHSLPDAVIFPDGNCPKCGFPLKAKTLGKLIVFICKNPKCDYFTVFTFRKGNRGRL